MSSARILFGSLARLPEFLPPVHEWKGWYRDCKRLHTLQHTLHRWHTVRVRPKVSPEPACPAYYGVANPTNHHTVGKYYLTRCIQKMIPQDAGFIVVVVLLIPTTPSLQLSPPAPNGRDPRRAPRSRPRLRPTRRESCCCC